MKEPQAVIEIFISGKRQEVADYGIMASNSKGS